MVESTTLWDYAVTLYGQPGVREACLDLQDRCDLDVDLLLFAVWSAAAGPGQLNVQAFNECIELTAAWREGVLKPLRGARRASASMPGALAGAIPEQLQATELNAERVELDMLERWAADRPPVSRPAEPEASAASNLVAYLAAAGIETGTAATAIRTLLAAAFRPADRA